MTFTFPKLASFMGALILVTACAPPAPSSAFQIKSRVCSLESQQVGSLYGRWKLLALPIAFRRGQWTQAEMAAVMDAADVWNTFYQAVAGFPVLDYGSRSMPNQLDFNFPGDNLCSYTVMEESQTRYRSPIVIFKQNTWSYAGMSGAVALTKFCKRSGTSLPSLYMGTIEANYQNFFGQGKRQPDLKSIFVHELGHILGLDHSCLPSGSTTSGMVSCALVESAKPDYRDAVMYPTVSFGSDGEGVVKDILEYNDQARANCLYGPTAL